MSASREKRSRKGTQEEILNQKLIEAEQQKKKVKKNVVTGVIIFLVVAVLIGSIVLFRGPYFVRNTVAMTVGDHELSPIQVRYFYQDAYQDLLDQGYSSILTTMYGEGVEFQDIVVDNTTGQTWAQMILTEAMDTIRSCYAFYDMAMAENYVLSAAGEENLKYNMTMIDLYAQMNSMTPDNYVRALYGHGASRDSYEEYQRLILTVNEYQVGKAESFEYTEEQLTAKYEEDPSLFNLYNYHSYINYAASTDENGEALSDEGKAAAMEEAKAESEAIAEAGKDGIDAYLQAIADLTEDESYLEGTTTLRENLPLSSISTAIQEWVKDPARQEGDTTTIELEGSGYYVLYWLSSFDNDYDTYNVRTIMISANTTDADGKTVLDWDAAETELKALQTDIEASSDFPADLANLASTYTDDTSAPSGSLYEYTYYGQFDPAVDAWLFDEAREIGDSAVIQGNSAYFYVYVESEAGNYLDYLVSQELRIADYNALYSEVTAAITVEQNDAGMNHVDPTLITPMPSAS